MKFVMLILLGSTVAAMVPAPLNIQCITDIECELMYGLLEDED